jgi:hypothetical protein
MRARPSVMIACVVAGCATPAPSSFELELGGLPSVVAVRTDDGVWTKLAPYSIAPTTTGYLIPFADTLDVMVACKTDDYASLHELRTTRDELDAMLGAWDRPNCAPARLTSRLSGHIHTTLGESQLGLSAANGSDPAQVIADAYDFSFPVEAAELDFAVWDDAHLALRHDLDLRTPTTLPVIDLDQEATLIAGTFGYDPLPSDMVLTGQVGIRTPRGLDIRWDTPAGSPRVVPYGVLAADDTEWVAIEGASGSGFQRFTGSLGAAFPDHVSFLPPITGVAVAGMTVTWRAFVDQFTEQLLRCSDARDGVAATYGYDVTEAAGWVMNHGIGTIAIDLGAPGLPDFTQQIGDCTLEVQHGLPSTQFATSGVRSL